MSETLTNQIGEQLKAARLAKNLSLEDVQAATKIQARYLEAIENNNLSILPGDFYVRAFIRQYAIAVGLNPETLLGETTPPSISRSRDLSRAHRDNDGVVRAGTNPNPSPRSKFSDMLPKVWLAIFILVGLVAVWFAMTHLGNNDQQNSDSGNVSVSTSTIPSSSSSDASSAASSSEKPAEKKPEPKVTLGTPEQNTALQTTIYNLSGQADKQHTIKVTAQGAGTNVKVTVGTTVLLNELVKADKTVDVPAGTNAVNVQFTNVANATMTFDDQKVAVIGTATPFWNVLFNLNK